MFSVVYFDTLSLIFIKLFIWKVGNPNWMIVIRVSQEVNNRPQITYTTNFLGPD